MNIIKELTARIEQDRKETANPCKNYATEENAEKATAKIAMEAAKRLGQEKSAQYVVFYIEAWGRWVGVVGLSELMNRRGAGGFVGHAANQGFYCF